MITDPNMKVEKKKIKKKIKFEKVNQPLHLKIYWNPMSITPQDKFEHRDGAKGGRVVTRFQRLVDCFRATDIERAKKIILKRNTTNMMKAVYLDSNEDYHTLVLNGETKF